MWLAPKALSHDSLGQRPRNSITQINQALKARFSEARCIDGTKMNRAFSASAFWGTANPGATPQVRGERRAFGAKHAG
jgi:hypothetical protein